MSCRSSVQYYICIQFPLLIISYEHIINRQIINTLHFDWNICCSCTSHNLDLAARPGVSDNSSPNQQAHCPHPLCAPCILWQQEIKIRWSTTLTWRLGQVSATTVPKSASLGWSPTAPCTLWQWEVPQLAQYFPSLLLPVYTFVLHVHKIFLIRLWNHLSVLFI